MTPPPEFWDAAHPHMRQPVPQTHRNGQATKAGAPSQGEEAPKDTAHQKGVCIAEAETPFMDSDVHLFEAEVTYVIVGPTHGLKSILLLDY